MAGYIKAAIFGQWYHQLVIIFTLVHLFQKFYLLVKSLNNTNITVIYIKESKQFLCFWRLPIDTVLIVVSQ